MFTSTATFKISPEPSTLPRPSTSTLPRPPMSTTVNPFALEEKDDKITDKVKVEYYETRSDRIREAMFPETVAEDAQILSTQIGKKLTAVQRLAEPSQMLKLAIVNLINYRDDVDLATRALPELIKLLNDEDQVVVSQAAVMVHQLSRKEASRHAIMNNTQVVASLIRSVSNTSDKEVIHEAAGTLQYLSHHRQGLLAIFKSGGIPALVKLLNSPVESVLFYVVTTLHNLLLHQDGSRMTVRVAGGIQRMVALLRATHVKLLTMAAHCLHILAFGNQESKLIILASQGPAELMRIMSTYKYEKLLWTASRLLKVLSVCPSNKSTIVEAGAIRILVAHLNNPSQRLVQNIMYTLRNLSDAVGKCEGIDHAIVAMVRLLNCKDTKVITCAAGFLSNITCNNANNKLMTCRVGGIEALVDVVQSFINMEEMVEPAARTLHHLTSHHPDAEVARSEITSRGGTQLIVSLLGTNTKWPLAKAIVGLIRNLALSPANYDLLRELGTIKRVSDILVRAFLEVQRQNTASISSSHPPPSTIWADGVQMDKIIECAVSALQILARDGKNRVIIRNQQRVVAIIVRLLYHESDNMKRRASGALCELAAEKEGVEVLEREQVADIMLSLLDSPNDGVATYAAVTLYRMSLVKSEEYKAQITNEITRVLVRNEQNKLLLQQEMANRQFMDLTLQDGGYQ